jgi:hypothetical protein
MPIVCSVYAVKLSSFSFHLFLILPHTESQSLTRATPQVHQQQQTLIPPSPITTTLTSPLPSFLHYHYCSSCTSRDGIQQSSSQYQDPPFDSLSIFSVDHHQSQHCPLSAAIHSLLPPLVSAAHSLSLETELTRTLWSSSQVIPIVPELTCNSSRSTSLVGYSYYVPCQ